MERRTARRTIKIAILFLARTFGLFAIARVVTAGQLRILCYHGVGTAEDAEFAPGLFMMLATLRRRFQILRRKSYDVLPLDEAVAALHENGLPRWPVVITFDDGLHGNLSASRALIEEFRFPMTLYVTSYYVLKQTPVFRLVIRYMFWKSTNSTVSIEALSPKLNLADRSLDLTSRDGAAASMWSLVTAAESCLSEQERVDLSRELGRRLGVDYEQISRDRRLSLLTMEEIGEMSRLGVDIELHTHRHCMPSDM